ncbi:MAG: hypothetical protein R2750_02805 [Bacteroidales bacterium]
MLIKNVVLAGLVMSVIALSSCSGGQKSDNKEQVTEMKEMSGLQEKLDNYVSVKLTSDISHLSDNESKCCVCYLMQLNSWIIYSGCRTLGIRMNF